MNNDRICLKTPCPHCKNTSLIAEINPSGYDNDGHADDVEVSAIRCLECNNTDIPEEEYNRVYELYIDHCKLAQIGTLYQEL